MDKTSTVGMLLSYLSDPVVWAMCAVIAVCVILIMLILMGYLIKEPDDPDS
jgi:hypothetical protein